MMETRLIPKKFLKLIKNLADENRNYKKIFGNVFWLEVVKEKNYSWFNLRLNSNFRAGSVKMLRRIKTAVSDFRCRSDADVLERGKVVSGLRKK